jgi:hypothetical protein
VNVDVDVVVDGDGDGDESGHRHILVNMATTRASNSIPWR